MKTKLAITSCLLALGMLATPVQALDSEDAGADQSRPNILWLSAEDISPHFGCYGDPHAITPTIDNIAKQGVRYSHVFTSAGVCAPCRSGIITGIHQTSLGTQHMRSNATLPPVIKPFSTYLRRQGYYCTNNVKQDYQFKAPAESWDVSSKTAHWQNRPDQDQPFFAVFNFVGCHESGIANESKYRLVTKNLSADQRQDPQQLDLPPYYPDTPVVREAWKRNYELITAFDQWCAEKIQQVQDAGLADQTIIMIWSDHGIGMPRAKRWLYDSGTHVPLVVLIPEKFQDTGGYDPGSVDDQMISSIDFGPTVLSLAGVTIPDVMQGRAFLGNQIGPRRIYVHGARDRMDERNDIIRSVRSKDFLYIRNYEPLKTYYQYINSAEKGDAMRELRRLHEAGSLSPVADYYFSPTKPVEELYDCRVDPHNINNVAALPSYGDVLDELRAEHVAWAKQSRDTGLIPEPILRKQAEKAGSEYEVLRRPGSEKQLDKIVTTAINASTGMKAFPEMIQAAEDENAAVRYWAATGLGNLGVAVKGRPQAVSVLEKLLQDASSTVRSAAALGLCRMGKSTEALPTLIEELTTGRQWERLYAAIALDEIDELARPVVDQMKVGLEYQKGFVAEGKYRVRVMNRALNELLGTDHVVK